MTSSARWSVVLRDGSHADIAHVEESDAEALLRYVEQVAGETSFLSFGAGEFGISLAQEVAYLRSLGRTGTGFMLKAVVAERLVGIASLKWGLRPRIRHVGEFGLSVEQRHSGKGIGRALSERTMREAVAHAVTRVELKVRHDNQRAIGLYESLGFAHEGRLRGALRVNGETFDECVMGLLLDPPGAALALPRPR